MNYYVYTHSRKTDGKVFYVGKGSKNRAYKKTSRNRHWNNIVAKHGYIVNIVATFTSEEAAFKAEIALISKIGLSNLANKTTGGEGCSGLVYTLEMRKEASKRCYLNNPSKHLHVREGRSLRFTNNNPMNNPDSVAKKSGKNNHMARSVINLDTGDVFETIKLAEATTGASNPNITKVCKGLRKTAGGYRWAYAT